jgi:type II secretory ATPase GspE/PulE/Tfp pilus assembly ATPase PilB-like protein
MRIGSEWVAKNKLYRGRGCKQCNGIGYMGRTRDIRNFDSKQ